MELIPIEIFYGIIGYCDSLDVHNISQCTKEFHSLLINRKTFHRLYGINIDKYEGLDIAFLFRMLSERTNLYISLKYKFDDYCNNDNNEIYKWIRTVQLESDINLLTLLNWLKIENPSRNPYKIYDGYGIKIPTDINNKYKIIKKIWNNINNGDDKCWNIGEYYLDLLTMEEEENAIYDINSKVKCKNSYFDDIYWNVFVYEMNDGSKLRVTDYIGGEPAKNLSNPHDIFLC
ncbi:F-box domain-containing protein [Orpheovirus IHUMI-LCC2]|uniref:F-box domain-containing protein n=1 Tax=Orpheovirus IHUMI-LCC2 TaxID=2023057 RepID=A0A2I2L3V0_9VIRU|nr:F-box domain-containing protein [Orpheovirus IHUMI-LCC2]SNW62139.1 F-box domain-containing protein [Orpheovirus IHUMI-LCC2]